VSKEPTRTFPPGTVIFREGDEPDYIYVLMAGQVEISARRDEARIVLTHLVPNQLFGELALLDSSPRSATATTVQGCEVIAITREQFFKKLDTLDPFSRYWILYLADRLKDLSRRAYGL
jgi:CRP-like cAMP-binding protein